MINIGIDLQIIPCLVLVLLLTQNLEADSNVRCFENERGALLEFRRGVADQSMKLKSWVGEDCCSWVGVSCNNSNGHVTKLELRGISSRYFGEKGCEDSCLGGEISHSLINLTHLNYLDLSVNNFSEIGIPNFLGSFKILEYLNFSQVKFIGNIPSFNGNISRLKYLDLSYNSELIVDSLSFVSNLTSLEFLDLSGLNLSAADDWLHYLNMLPSLMELHLSSCYLSSFPEFLQFNFTSLAVLDLSSNTFNSTISPLFFNITNIRHLDLSGNQLQGRLPREIGNLEFLKVLFLQDNDLEGELPLMNSLCHLQELDLSKNSFSGEIGGIIDISSSDCISPSLKSLDLSNNDFRGVIPDSLGKFTRLESLSLYRNSFEGRIPEAIGRLSNLRELSLFNNFFNGSVPESIGLLTKLEVLDLNSNELDSVVSKVHFSTLESLTTLSMYGNSIVFDIDPTWVAPFRQLESVYLSSCELGPEFPQWLSGLTNNSLKLLDLYNTSISGSVPDWFQNVSANIQWLDLSHNQITKNLPKFGKPSTPVFVRVIYLNSNKFSGPITALPGDVEVLDISNNLLSGQIPQTVSDMMPQLRFLSLSNNNLSGDIPSSFCNLTELSYLDLSKNQLSGVIPGCWKDMQFLNVLDLAYNRLAGSIPVSLGSLQSLGALHLERNMLQGDIPTSLGNLTNLLTLDLSENAFTGTFPSWIDGNLSLAVLSLHSNMLKGEIPAQICGITSLRILNLANNTMTGTIPSCFDNFTSMIVEDPDFLNYWLSGFSFPVLFQMPGRYSAYQDHVLTYIKGRELEYDKNIQFLLSIDLSDNNFIGKIPNELLNLKLVQNLNLSTNKLTGNIPTDIGNMKALESLDFSRNGLSGSIPASISSLNFLSHLNLSFNNLSGPIPQGNQLQTLDDKSIYIGNYGLCGFPLQSCQKEQELDRPGKSTNDNNDQDESEMRWFYYGLGAGFMTGFVVVCSSLYFNRSWRHALFESVDKIYNKVYVTFAVKKNQLKRNSRES